MTAIAGIYAAAVTPWQAGNRLHERALEQHLEMLLAAGVDGICIGGSTGEFTRASDELRARLLETALAVVRGRAPVLSGVGHASLDGTLALIEKSQGAAAVVVPPPFYFPYPQPELAAFYGSLARVSPLPVFIYNIPQFTSGLAPETAVALLRDGIGAGIKDSSGSPAMLSALAAARKESSFVFFCGNDEHLAGALQSGADGGLSGIAACAPELLVGLYRAFRAGDAERLTLLRERLDTLIARIGAFPAPIGIRLALETRGIAVGPHAVPLGPTAVIQAREFQAWFEKISKAA